MEVNDFIQGDEFNCHGSELDKLPEIPDYIKRVYCGYNNIKKLEGLPKNLEILATQNKKLKIYQTVYLICLLTTII